VCAFPVILGQHERILITQGRDRGENGDPCDHIVCDSPELIRVDAHEHKAGQIGDHKCQARS